MATCMDLWIHCMLCGSEWRSERQIYPETAITITSETARVTVEERRVDTEEKEPGEQDALSPQR